MKFPPFISVANPQSFLSQAELLPDYWLQLASTNSEIVVTPLVDWKDDILFFMKTPLSFCRRRTAWNCNWMYRPQGDSHIKYINKTGMLVGNFSLKTTPKKYQDPVLWAWLECFSPLRGTNSKQQLICSHIFSAQYPKRYRQSSRCVPFEAEHPKRHQTAFLTPKRTTSTLPFLYRSVVSDFRRSVSKELFRSAALAD